MATSPRQFVVEMYQEHVEEAAFLYEQCHSLRQREDFTWVDVGSFEARLEAHVDALMVGGATASDVCRRQAFEGDAGELFTAVSVLCRHADSSRLEETLEMVDLDVDSRATALTDALKYELPAQWHEYAVRVTDEGEQRLAAILATVIGYRRLPSNGVLARRLAKAEASAIRRLLWSIGRSQDTSGVPAVRMHLRSDDQGTATVAHVAALRLRDEDVLHNVMLNARRPTNALAAGLAAGPAATAGLLSSLETASDPANVVMALGLLGDLSAVRPLLDLFSDESLAGPASEALTVITGADIVEEVFVPDEIDEEELIPAELAAYRERGDVPRRLDGMPFGEMLRRPSRDRAVWEEQLKASASRFVRGSRYRWGQPCTPLVLLGCLQSQSYPIRYRGWIVDELLIRYGIDLAFESDMLVARQERVIRRAIEKLRGQTVSYQPGRWCVAGAPIG